MATCLQRLRAGYGSGNRVGFGGTSLVLASAGVLGSLDAILEGLLKVLEGVVG